MKMRVGVAAVASATAAASFAACGSGSPPTARHTPTTYTTGQAAPLPSPAVTGVSGQMRAPLHARDHTPAIGVKWEYMVEATDAMGQPLTGTVATQFLYGTAVVGHESPPMHPLTHGRLVDEVTYTPPSDGIQLTFEVVVTTPVGKVTLNWPVVPHKT